MTKEVDTEPEILPKTEQTKTLTPKSHKKLVLSLSAVVLAIGLVIVGYFVYAKLQQQQNGLKAQIKEEKDKVAVIEKQNQKLSSNLSDANTQIKSLKETIKKTTDAEAVIPKLTLKVDGVTKDSRGYGYSGNYKDQEIIVDVTLTNNSKATAYLSASDFRLKDGGNNTSTTNFDASWPPAANKKALKTQAVAPGEVVSGSIAFNGVSTAFSSFTFYYLEEAVSVSPKDATYSWYTYSWCVGKEGTGELGC